MDGRNGRLSGRLMMAACWRLKASTPDIVAPSARSPRPAACRPSRALWISTGMSNCSCALRAPSRSAVAISSRRCAAALRRIGARAGVEQRQPRHALRRLPHDLVGDVAAHGESREREPLRRRRQDRAGDGRPWCRGACDRRRCISAMSPSASIWGAHSALVHSRPGTSTRFVFAAAMTISCASLRHSSYPACGRPKVTSAVTPSGSRNRQKNNILGNPRPRHHARALFFHAVAGLPCNSRSNNAIYAGIRAQGIAFIKPFPEAFRLSR